VKGDVTVLCGNVRVRLLCKEVYQSCWTLCCVPSDHSCASRHKCQSWTAVTGQFTPARSITLPISCLASA